MIGDMASCVERLGQISPRSPMLIKHHPIHLNKGSILALNDAILLGDIRRGKLILKAQRSTKGFKMSILEFCAIVSANCSLGILRETHFATEESNPKHVKEPHPYSPRKHLRVARKIIHDH
jgi:hypothetical protein